MVPLGKESERWGEKGSDLSFYHAVYVFVDLCDFASIFSSLSIPEEKEILAIYAVLEISREETKMVQDF